MNKSRCSPRKSTRNDIPRMKIINEEITGTRSQAILMKYTSGVKLEKSAVLNNSSRLLSHVIGDLQDDIQMEGISEWSSSEANAVTISENIDEERSQASDCLVGRLLALKTEDDKKSKSRSPKTAPNPSIRLTARL